jgi:hypothetical protein
MFTFIFCRERKVVSYLNFCSYSFIYGFKKQFFVQIPLLRTGDFKRNDDVYEELEKQDLNTVLDVSDDRIARTTEEMSLEADKLRSLFCHFGL